MAAPNHVHHQPAAGASSSASPKAAGCHDPSVSPDRDDPTRLLVEMLAGTALGTPMAAPNYIDHQPQAAAGVAAAGASVSATAGHCPGVAPDGDDDLTLTLTKAFATTTLETAAAVANKAAPGVSASPLVRAIPDTPAAAAKPAGSRAERRARRSTRFRLIRVPTDYLRAGQESRDRSRRRELVRRCVGRLFAVHEDRASERGISAMMARLTTTLESASGRGDDAAAVSAAAPSSEHAGLAELLEKMALSKH
ncbi:unnamed protein product [Miscanthus lutarioriparius]|uniref:Uncharacterized protein n=1 Tax=Miscanthus lutarioriparius TaxID=422564 RepID=A0A811R4P7_9POAL|nr:unnamed protein product [Miscanthus lutarioriparius]